MWTVNFKYGFEDRFFLLVFPECSRGWICLPLPAREVKDLHAKQRREELPHLLQAVCRGVRRHQEETASGLSGQLQGQWASLHKHTVLMPYIKRSVTMLWERQERSFLKMLFVGSSLKSPLDVTEAYFSGVPPE